MDKEKLKRTKLVSGVLRFLNHGYSTCQKCGLPWSNCKSKTVYFNESTGTFATCQYCWDHSTLDEIKQYYIGAYFKYKHYNPTIEHLLKCVENEYNNVNEFSTRKL